MPAVTTDAAPVEHLLLSMAQVREALGGMSREAIYNLTARGELRSRKIGRRRMFIGESVRDYVARLDENGPDR